MVTSASATGGELKSIERALMHPPPRADWFATAVSGLSAIFFLLKSCGAPILTTFDVVSVTVAACLCVALIAR
ncbi:MAG TPA: hypothetical protein VMI54_20725, partial [Polyangiaceae bacterium]|nr:hypothetical protein [Polyangiaceae bacterium]